MTSTDDDVVFRALRPTWDPTGFFPSPQTTSVLLRQGSRFGPDRRPAPLGSRWHGGTRPLPCDIQFDQDQIVQMRDGSQIYIDVFRPPGTPDVPAIVAWSPYGKQGGYWNYCRGNLGAVPPRDRVSGLQKFEGPDPAEWVQHGYAIIHPDPPGAFGSTGLLRTWGEAEGRHAYDLIEWVANQDWCSGRVAMAGNSWLSISQWFAAAQRPPHLAAIAPWNGFFDIYDFVAPGGVPAPQFAELLTDFQWGTRMEWLPAMIKKHPLKNPYWDTHDAALEDIDIPAYVAHSWALGVHKWTPEAFRRLGSTQKWLRLTNTHEWCDLYTPEYVADLKRFFDRYLKDLDNGWENTARVRVTVTDPALKDSESANHQHAGFKGYIPASVVDRPEHEWPLARTQYRKLFLSTAETLGDQPPATPQSSRYRARVGSASFIYTFAEETELTGYATARLWIETRGSQDADLFTDLCKLDSRGRRVGLFETATLRVSHREIDHERSTDFLTTHSHRHEKPLYTGEQVAVEISFAPASMVFRAGEKIRLRISGSPLRWLRDPTGGTLGGIAGTALAPVPTRNRGTHIIHYGGDFEAHIAIPIIPNGITA